MLIEFSVRNFRSFRERQTLSMVAAPRLQKRENVFVPELDGEKNLKLLKVAVVYGSNASGKSNLLKALHVLSEISGREASSRDVPLPVSPFRFDSTLADEPSEFELHFIQKGMRYQFNLSATADRIITERLIAYPKGKESLMYQRKFHDSIEEYGFGDMMSGNDDVRNTWIRITPPRVMFITQAVANSNEQGGPLEAPYAWLNGSMLTLLQGMGRMISGAQNLVQKNSTYSKDISSFLCTVDIPISQIKVETLSEPLDGTTSQSAPLGLLRDQQTPTQFPRSKTRTTLTHTSALGEAALEIADESEGTRNLIGFWLPWTTKDPSDRNARCILVIDELDSSLHPRIVVALVAKHIRSSAHSQLIFSTHDTHLMDSKLLRRDQYWTTERDINGATMLRSMHDFVGREGEDLEKRYFEGRYRGLPLVTAD